MLLAEKRDAIVSQWVARTLASYPEQSARFLLQEKDRFRNPAGYLFREGLPALFDELNGEWRRQRVEEILEPLIRLRAVQDFTAGQAVGFIFLLKQVLREHGVAPGEQVFERIDQLALVAFDLFMKCREEAYEIRAREAQRRSGVRFQVSGEKRSATVPDA